MGCTKCKKKKPQENIKQQVKPQENIKRHTKPAQKNNSDGWITWTIIIWFLLGCYGIYCLVKNIVNLL